MTDTITEASAVVEELPPARSLAARLLGGVGWTFIWFGLLTVGFFFHQIYVTTWVAQQEQAQLEEDRVAYFAEVADQIQPVIIDPSTGETILDVETGEPITLEAFNEAGGFVDDPTFVSGDPGNPARPSRDGDVLSILPEADVPRGRAFALIRIPKLESLEEGWNVVEGVGLRQLRKGAGHMPQTPYPGQVGNSVIAGHRTTHGAPFRDFDQLEPGDRIEVETSVGLHVYEVRGVKIVRPTALWVTADNGPTRAGLEGGSDGSWLTLTTCHPVASAARRLIVFAQLIDGPNFATIDRLTG